MCVFILGILSPDSAGLSRVLGRLVLVEGPCAQLLAPCKLSVP